MKEHGYVYVIVRTDLSAPQIAVQSCHAVIEMMKSHVENEVLSSYMGCGTRHPKEHPSVIICGVKSLVKLENTIDKLYNEDICFHEFREPDIGNELTAIATPPIYGDERKFFRKYQLLK